MNKDHRHDEQNKPSNASEQHNLPVIGSTLRVAFERLIDQLDPLAAPEDSLSRTARRLGGRWLMLRRLTRGFTLAMVAERSKLGEQALELLELGLLDQSALPEDVWGRLCLVLEAPANDYERVGRVLRLATGGAEAFDNAFLQALEHEASVPEEIAPVAQPAPQPQVQAAPQLLPERLGILEALEDAVSHPLDAYRIKKWLEQQRRISLNPALLTRILVALARDGLVSRSSGERSSGKLYSYAITAEGTHVLELERRRAKVRKEQMRLAQEAHAEQIRLAQEDTGLTTMLSELTRGKRSLFGM